jgi:adenine-specific DNA-methyltransferase
MPTPTPTELPHSFELYMPTQCRCGNPLPAATREDVLAQAKQKMLNWFGGANIRTEPIRGLWPLKSGELAEESNDVICSFSTEDLFEAHRDDFVAYAAELANRLTQEGILCRVDSKTFIYPSTRDPKPHRCAFGSAPSELPAPLTGDAIARAKVLQASLQRIGGLKDARDLFCNVLHYEYKNEILPTRDWPDGVKQCLAPGSAPQIIAGQNGFKIIYLQLAEGILRKAHERQIVQRILKDIPDLRGLVVVSDVTQKQWNLVNVKFATDRKMQSGVQLRRMRVGPNQPVRTAVERLLEVDVEKLGESASAAQLQDAHDRAFDVEAVTKQFFNDVANWYFWALKHSTFPKDAPKEDDGHDHVSLIRLITRLIFCWFLREKGLMPDELFDRRKLKDILAGFAPEKVSNKDSLYYRAILQNLFFATLSTEMDKRAWVKDDQNFMAHSLYRFKECFQKPGTAMDLFKSIPFLNGGLFECLDKDLGEGAKPRYVRIDGFSRRADSQPTVPDFLFFGPEREVDLSKEYGDKKFKSVTVRGLIDTLRHYNFTIEENTPIEQEVALDPELCGKVFENLLAAYNPETGETARKQTGSFYTPREIVNYMVDEALIASLKTKLEAALPAAKNVEDRLRHLFAYNDGSHQFTSEEADALIAAIDSLKTIDPAVGSGAFPMGLLHKLVFVLGKLDPDNTIWRERQRQRALHETDAAFKLGDKEERQRRLEDINEVFEQNASDYGRKLYLIENCIYGVDIQSIAVQIAKMRFFISLIVDQKIDDEQTNRGVRPLPNLETKFVSANSLIGIERPEQQLLRNPDIDKKEAELRRVRERAFFARTPKQKTKCRDDDARLRSAISELLRDDGWDTTTARRLASWNPYDQNASADFFDPEWMFGFHEGFTIVIGNPPYVLIAKDDFIETYGSGYPLLSGKPDLYRMFIERGVGLLGVAGILGFIVPNTLLAIPSAQRLREFLTKNTSIELIIDLVSPVFGAAAVNNIIFQLSNLPSLTGNVRVGNAEGEDAIEKLGKLVLVSQRKWLENRKCEWTVHVSGEAETIVDKLQSHKLRLGNILDDLCLGMQVYHNTIHTASQIDSRYLHSTTRRGRWWLPEYSGRHISDYTVQLDKEVPFVNYAAEAIYQKPNDRFFSGPRLILREIVGDRLIVGYSDKEFAVNKSCYILRDNKATQQDLKALQAILGSSCVAFWVRLKGDKAKQALFPRITMNTLVAIPIPDAWHDQVSHLAESIDRILTKKLKNPNTDMRTLEREIDQQVCALYGLTPEEIRIIEASSAKV